MQRQWFQFDAHNAKTVFGFGTVNEARSYTYKLNLHRRTNRYIDTSMSFTDAMHMGLNPEEQSDSDVDLGVALAALH